ncbi:unnamed protein product [Musa acuminata subsp. burmannicoides]
MAAEKAAAVSMTGKGMLWLLAALCRWLPPPPLFLGWPAAAAPRIGITAPVPDSAAVPESPPPCPWPPLLPPPRRDNLLPLPPPPVSAAAAAAAKFQAKCLPHLPMRTSTTHLQSSTPQAPRRM